MRTRPLVALTGILAVLTSLTASAWAQGADHAIQFDGVDDYIQIEPELRITSLSEQQVLISWPASASDYSLQFTASLSALAPWASVTNPPGQIGDELAVTNNVAATEQFFRLVRVAAGADSGPGSDRNAQSNVTTNRTAISTTDPQSVRWIGAIRMGS